MNYSHYPQPPVIIQNPQAEIPMQMMMKLLEEMRSILKMQNENQMSILNDKRVFQDTLSKMILTNPNLMTQQVPASQLPQPPK